MLWTTRGYALTQRLLLLRRRRLLLLLLAEALRRRLLCLRLLLRRCLAGRALDVDRVADPSVERPVKHVQVEHDDDSAGRSTAAHRA